MTGDEANESPRRPSRPSGMAPPEAAELPGGIRIQLPPLAEEICRRHLERHPEDVERYGQELAHDWCVHDNQHILAWAIEDRDLSGQIAWLANVLGSRGYPVANLRDNVLQGAEVISGALPQPAAGGVAERMRAAVEGLTPPDGG